MCATPMGRKNLQGAQNPQLTGTCQFSSDPSEICTDVLATYRFLGPAIIDPCRGVTGQQRVAEKTCIFERSIWWCSRSSIAKNSRNR